MPEVRVSERFRAATLGIAPALTEGVVGGRLLIDLTRVACAKHSVKTVPMLSSAIS